MKSALQRQSGSNDGFTLLELLVAITIFSLVIGMAMFSLRYTFGVFRHLDAPFAEETRRITGLRDCIASTFVYIGERSDMFNRNKEFYTFFYGEPDRLTFITSKPLILTGMAICRLSLRDGAVVLEESPVYANDSNYLNPSILPGERRETIIFHDVKSFSLEYFQGGVKLDAIKEDLPSLIKVVLQTEEKREEFCCRISTDFNNKKQLVRGMNEPL